MRRSGQANHRESLRSVGEIEAEVGRAIVGFLQETHGRGAREISVHLHRDTVLVMLTGVIAEPQQRLVANHSAEDCACLLKQFRARVLTLTIDRVRELILSATGFRPRTVLHDFLPESGEEMFVFHLEGIPSVRM
jgi:uncharacterized protein YbcI